MEVMLRSFDLRVCDACVGLYCVCVTIYCVWSQAQESFDEEEDDMF